MGEPLREAREASDPRPSSNPWAQAASGKPIDLIEPLASEVDFREIADVLSRINRYAGNSLKPVSVAQHTLIACDAVTDEFKPWVLLHDAHEARLGDITTPVVEALDAIIDPDFAPLKHASNLIAELKRRHDRAIYQAAGLSWPTLRQQQAVRRADLVAMQTERRDFCAPARRPWAIDRDVSLVPLPRAYRLRPAPDVADALYALFRLHLPALAGI